MTLRPVGAVGVAMRVQVGAEQRTAFVELQLGHQKLTLTQASARTLIAGIEQMLVVAEKFDAEDTVRHGAPEQPTLSYSSDLTLTVDVVHDNDRDELTSVVAARIETILERVKARWAAGTRRTGRRRSPALTRQVAVDRGHLAAPH